MPFFKKITVFLLLLISFAADAQYSELGISLGASRYKGELSPHLFDIKFIHPSAGIFYRRNRTRHWSWRFDANYAKVSGDDSALPQFYGFQRNRNLNFSSIIIEGTFAYEFNFFPFETGNDRYPFTPYIHTGLTCFYFNPKMGGVKLQPLETEGVRYSRVTFAIPIGGGFKINMGNVSIALQVSARRTYTDYLDDVSTIYYYGVPDPSLQRDSALLHGIASGKQRGDMVFKDWYVIAGINIFIRLTNFQKEFCRPFKRRRY